MILYKKSTIWRNILRSIVDFSLYIKNKHSKADYLHSLNFYEIAQILLNFCSVTYLIWKGIIKMSGKRKSFAKQNHLRKMKIIEFTYILSYFEAIVNAKVVKTYEKYAKKLDKLNKFL